MQKVTQVNRHEVRWLTTADVMRVYSLARYTINRLVEDRKLHPRRIGNKDFYSVRELENVVFR